MRSGGTWNSQWASMTSKPLFMRVAESMVIFPPMFQVGWARASSTVTRSSSSLVLSRKGPPEAVRITLCKSRSPTPCRHWKMALCSLSTGRSRTLCSLTASITTLPAATSVSLFAKATSFPALMAAKVGRMPAAPTTAFNTRSTPSIAAISSMALGPVKILRPGSSRLWSLPAA